MSKSSRSKQSVSAGLFSSLGDAAAPGILLPVAEFGKLVCAAKSTVYDWINQGRLNGALFRTPGKLLIMRDKGLDLIHANSV